MERGKREGKFEKGEGSTGRGKGRPGVAGVLAGKSKCR